MSKTSVMRAVMSPLEAHRSPSCNTHAMRCFLAFTFLAAQSAYAADAFFCSDSFTAGDTLTFERGFGPGEEAAVRIDPDASALPLSLTQVYLFYGDVDDLNASEESLKVYDVDGSDFTGAPGTV